MLESFQCEAAKSALGDFCEKCVSHLLETVCRNPGKTVRNGQPDGAKRKVWYAATSQIINGPCLQYRAKDCDEFGCHQCQKGKYNTRTKIKITSRPDERCDTFYHAPSSFAFASFRCRCGIEWS